MRFTVPFLMGLAAFAVTVFGANWTSFRVNEDLIFDIGLAADSIAFRLENGFAMPENPALVLGLLLLAVPATFVFHLFRLLLGGSAQRLRAEGRANARVPHTSIVERLLNEEELTAPARVSNATVAPTARTEPAAAAASRVSVSSQQPASARPSSGATLNERLGDKDPTGIGGETGDADETVRTKWRGILENRPNLNALKQQASGIRASLKRMRGPEGGSSTS